ncbi:CynX/NimT family MFS transporter [Xanthobacteraceae bacterium A53D]
MTTSERDPGSIELVDAEAGEVPPPEPHRTKSALSRFILGASLVLIAANLRPIFSSASVLLPEMRTDLGLSPLQASVLMTLPVVCLGLFSPLAPKLARRFGSELTLLAVIILVAIGTAARGLSSIPFLIAGTALAGASIAVGNALLPGVVKRDFPDKAALMTGFYTMAICAGGAGGAGLTQPLEHLLGGSLNLALAVWAVPALLVALLWLPQVLAARTQVRHKSARIVGLWREPLAWQIMMLMGFQSALAYCLFGWGAPLLRERGLDAVAAGGIISLNVMAQGISCMLMPHIAVRYRQQSVLTLILSLISVSALLAFVFAPAGTIWLWAVVQGIGQGGLLAVGLTVIVLRSPDAQVAAELSGMAHFGGYLIAATGPLFMGLLKDWTGSFTSSALVFVIFGSCAAVNGWLAGRALTVKTSSRP